MGLPQLYWRNVAAVLVDASVVEPVDPFRGGELDLINALPWGLGLDDLGLEQPVDRLRESIVTARADRPDRGGDAFLGKPL